MKEIKKSYLHFGDKALAPAGFIADFDNSRLALTNYIDSGISLESNTVDIIYCNNFLSNLSLAYICKFLRECRRVIKPGGVIRITCADFDEIISRIQHNDWKALLPSNMKWVATGSEYINVLTHEEKTWLLDETELKRLLSLCGFEYPTRKEPVASDIQSFSFRKEKANALVIEAKKRSETQMISPLVSITIPAYRSDFIASSIQSAISQTYPTLEIIIVDDSPDRKIEGIVRQFIDRDSRIHYERNPKPLGEARNLTRCINLAKGDYIKPLYDDDIITPECVEKLVKAYHDYPDIRLATCRRTPIDNFGSSLEPSILGPALASKSGSYLGQDVLQVILAGGTNLIGEPTVMLFRRDDIQSLNEPDVMSVFGKRCSGIGDIGLAFQLLSRGNLAYIAETLANFRMHSGQNQRRPGFRKWVDESWIYLRKHAERIGLLTLGAPDTQQGKQNNKQSADSPPSSAHENLYHAWLAKRNSITCQNHWPPITQDEESRISFLFIIRLPPNANTSLADTLDSMNIQQSSNWHLTIVSSETAPEGVQDIPCLSWTVVTPEHEKAAIDSIVEGSNYEWIIELPVGAVLDPCYLWQMTKHISANSNKFAIFVDDDSYDKEGVRKKPRFKPGVNPAALQASNLAGILCVKRENWLDTGGTWEYAEASWFYKLLNLAKTYGWDSINHIPDILISLPENPPNLPKASLVAIDQHLQESNPSAHVSPIDSDSWNIIQSLPLPPPSVDVFIFTGGDLGLLQRCFTSIIECTAYKNFRVNILLDSCEPDPDVETWLEKLNTVDGFNRVIRKSNTGTFGSLVNHAITGSNSDFSLFANDESVSVQSEWLEELVRACTQDGVVAASPRLLISGNNLLENTGHILGLNGFRSAPFSGQGNVKVPGQFDWINCSRDITTLTSSSFIIRNSSAISAGLMDETAYSDQTTVADFSLRLIEKGGRLLYVPRSNLAGSSELPPPVDNSFETQTHFFLERRKNLESFKQRWWPRYAIDPYWNPNLSLTENTPTPETSYFADWHFFDEGTPRMLAHVLGNTQGDYRVKHPLNALRKLNRVSTCIWAQRDSPSSRYLTVSEMCRLKPDVHIVQHYISDHGLAAMNEWHKLRQRPFTIYTLDDVITDIDPNSPFFMKFSANNHSRLKLALSRCDRMVVSTDFLANLYKNLIPDIRIVPNRLEMEKWLPLRTKKRTSSKPRIGWAGGNTHREDLLLLKEVIKQTRDEADWVFFGICPEELLPMVAETHPFVPFEQYPAFLASLNLDIAVAPLANTVFNQGKSNLRLLELGALGLPIVCTDIDPYRNSPACRVSNTVEAWVNALRERTHDADAREQEGHTMRRWVIDNFLLETHLDDWMAAHMPS